MKIINANFKFENNINGNEILKKIEKAGRTAYKNNQNKKTSTKAFVNNLIKLKHYSVIEHCNISATIICDRATSHELVRHRLASYTQESQRYCAYSDEITVIKTPLISKENYETWLESLHYSEKAYKKLLQDGIRPEIARSVLPNAVKTEIVITANLREWRHIFELRCSKKAHPSMREIMLPMLEEMSNKIPVIFDDLKSKYLQIHV